MSFTFVYTNDYSIGIMQLMAILKANNIATNIVLSRYNFVEIAYLQYIAQVGAQEKRAKAANLLNQDQERIVNGVALSNPSVVGFSVTTDLYQYYLRIAKKIKSIEDYPVVMGGPHATFASNHVISQACVDALCVGEVDTSIVSVYETLRGSEAAVENSKGMWFKKGGRILKDTLAPLVEDLDSLPFADIDDFAQQNLSFASVYHVATARGCPFNCSYCNSSSYKRLYHGKGKYLRKRSPENVITELESVTDRYQVNEVRFTDDVFTMDSKWLLELLALYKKRVNLPFYCLLHPAMAANNLLERLKESGCHTVKMGMQTINPEICRKIYNRKLDIPQVKDVVSRLKKLHIQVKLDFIIGAPTESAKDLNDLVTFIKEIKSDDIFLYFLKYYPGADIIRFASEQNYLTTADIAMIESGGELPYQVIPERFKGSKRALYEKFNRLIREAAGSRFRMENYDYLLEC